MLNPSVAEKVVALGRGHEIPSEDRSFVNTQIAKLAEALTMRKVKNLDLIEGVFPGHGGQSPERCDRGNRQRFVDQDVLWTLFTNGKRGDYVVYFDFPA